MAAINWNCAGNSAWCLARDNVMCPFSKGSRKASSASLENSGSSSKNSKPWCASEISPGRGGAPPPTKAALVALWRQAGTHAMAAAELHDPRGRTRGAADPQALAQSLAPDTAALAALRGWLAARLNWAPG